jgi:hypothetical protein
VAFLGAEAPEPPSITAEPVDGRKNRTYLGLVEQAVESGFKVLMVPFRWGEEQPVLSTRREPGRMTTALAWSDQEDQLLFETQGDGRTRLSVGRDDGTILQSR